MNYSVLRKCLSTTSIVAIAATLAACSGDLERQWGDPSKRGYTPNQQSIFTNSTKQVPVQSAAVQSMPAAVAPARPVTQPAPVYSPPQTVYVTPPAQQQFVTNSIPSATPQSVYSQPMPPIVQAPTQSVPVTVASNRVPVTAPVSVPVNVRSADYTATSSINSTPLSGPPVVVSRFDSMPKAAPRAKQTQLATYRPQTLAPRATVNVPIAAQPMPPKPVEQTRRFSISKFFSLPKSSPKPKAVDYTSTASIQPPAAIQSQNARVPVANRPILNQQRVSAPRTSGQWTSAGGSMITALPGDDIQGLSRRYGVPAKAIADVNGLVDQSFIAPGQQLIIPVYQQAQLQPAPSVQPQTRWQSPSVQTSSLPTMPIALRVPKANPLRLQSNTPYAVNVSRHQQQANAQNRHMVMPGDTLSGIASRYGVSTKTLAQVNGLSPTSRIRMGQRLRIPQKNVDYTSTASINRQSTVVTAVSQQKVKTPLRLAKLPKTKPRFVSKASTPKSKVTRRKVAALSQPVGLPDDVQSDARPVSQPSKPSDARVASNDPQFRWPVRGRIISNYGRKRDGGRNDGINLAVPAGTSVRVAESGTVIYAGDKLKGYGNLVLVQHANGYVTAYAHNEKIMVSKGQQVRRGQIISQAGRSGDVDSPQLHFELRIKGDPVDPVPYLVSS
ncbi:LysM peptidoglycan-binding domain-containing protein [Cohaesibacter sp. CAU 1516]|uniref:LysM peptidoglycan-binding domain-containing M23 family metallopeptidase n=1 Tax=Cohaesibacter sp. CAU 1516 TaxID=2576038 RepID=UPI0010FF572A|nr:LysM peptidoglycan-binding domain-containing M23 family metallopeptidase [Cohaesibacter sp. CAU 1516]TLP49083.1 LysM peptidoglycan-binding domain-containing protein [Cohaesibacter sp. CAU 1516]